MADLENGVFAGWDDTKTGGAAMRDIATNTALRHDFVTVILVGDTSDKNDGKGRFALYGADATAGSLKTMYDGIRPTKGSGYAPMQKEGSIILGTGGDNSVAGGGQWFESVMATGAATPETLERLQANIVAARYGK